MLDIRNVWKTYGSGEAAVQALRGIELSVKKGDYIALIGPSGCGKSSLLHMMGAMDVPTSGDILFGGVNIGKLNHGRLASLRLQRIGFIFQTFNLIPSLSALENVAIPMKLAGMSPREVRTRSRQLLEQVNLSDRAAHLPSELSGGQRQRVAIARALGNDPELILADEPTGNLDTKNGEIIIEYLLKLHKEGRTIVMVTHNPELAEKASRIVHMRDGQISERVNVER